MGKIKVTVRGGRLEVDEPINLPDGTELEIPLPDDGEGPMPADEIVRVLAAMDRIEPLDLTDTERAAWVAERADRKAREMAAFAEQSEEFRRMWDDPIPPR
ncbi:hypothetical protein [Frigoriglobus tundricola]|uniref:Uncharacterized protein n=1 Tax=Frigoriglobus tundricola TaxID=2774151 RepID=A0A6M5YTU2_9BACT|nr:hypothetical protein [Frigoriglobus tundricola]QJW96780.1 hypothetical protein FTUN_4339 [Frigoriglobus tundricola]